MEKNSTHSRRNFIKKATLGTIGLSTFGFSARSYGQIIGANDRVRVAIVGFSNRFKDSLFPAFMDHAKAQNFQLVGVSDIWNRRRNEAAAFVKEKANLKIQQIGRAHV